MEQDNLKDIFKMDFSETNPSYRITATSIGRDFWSVSQSREVNIGPTESWSDLASNLLMAQILGRRDEDITRLSDELEGLKAEIAQLKNQKTINVQVKNIYSNRLNLTEPLNVLLQDESGYFTAKSIDFDTYGVGDSTQEAIKDLGENIEDIYFTFKTEGKNKLGPDMLKIWNFMALVLKENKNATKSRRGKKGL